MNIQVTAIENLVIHGKYINIPK